MERGNTLSTESTRPSGISAVILAAGSSQRMGAPKQLLRLGPKFLLEHALDAVRAACVDEVILVLGFAAEEIRRTIAADGVTVVVNENYREGMGTSLRLGISSIKSGARGAFIVLADQPLVRPSTLDRMIAFHREHSSQIVIPTYHGFRGNPVLLDRTVFPELAGIKGDVGCRAIFGSHTQGIHKLPVADPGILLDADTLDDFHKLEAIGESGKLADLSSVWCIKESRPSTESSVTGPELIVVGRDAVAVSLVRLAHVLRFATTVVDPFLKLQELPEADRILHSLDFSMLPKNPDRHVVVASRGQFDEEGLEQAFLTDAPYIALLANRKRGDELKRILGEKGVSPEKLDRLRCPAGMEIAAESPEEIALSILTQIVAERHQVHLAH
jgi:molybdenum cofactor cytidylyltransferase